VQTSHPEVAVVPVVAQVESDRLLRASIDLDGIEAWPPVHSAWLCPEIPFCFEIGVVPEVAVARHAPAPV
jgi:hypothetical protein